jgi:anti-anti-sigma factor
VSDAAGGLEISIRSTDSTAVFDIDGNINNQTLHRLSRGLDQAISKGCVNIILELADTQILLSSGIGFFIDAHDMVEAAGGRLILADVPKEIATILKVARVGDFFGKTYSLEEALKEFGLSVQDLEEGLPNRKGGTTDLFAPVLMEEEPKAPAAGKATDSPLPAQPHSSGSETPKQTEKAEEKDLTEQEIQHILDRYMKGRLQVDIIDYFVAGQHSSGDADQLAEVLGAKPKAVKKALKALDQRGLLRKMGGGLYNYAPPTEAREEIEKFFILWHRSTGHSRLLPLVLASEK